MGAHLPDRRSSCVLANTHLPCYQTPLNAGHACCCPLLGEGGGLKPRHPVKPLMLWGATRRLMSVFISCRQTRRWEAHIWYLKKQVTAVLLKRWLSRAKRQRAFAQTPGSLLLPM